MAVSTNSLMGPGGANVPITVNAGGLLSISDGITAHLSGVLNLAGGTLGGPAIATAAAAYWGTWNLDNSVTAGGSPVTSVISAQAITLSHPGGTTFTVNPGAANGIDLDVTGTFYPTLGNNVDYGLIKTGPGVMRLDAANSYTSGTTLNAGGLVLADTAGSALGAGNLVINGGTLASDPLVGGSMSGNLTAEAAPR